MAPSGRKGRQTAGVVLTPHTRPKPRFPVTQGSRGLTQAERSREPTSRDPQLGLPWSSQPPPQTPGSGAETVERPETLFEPLWAQAGAADVKLADLRLAQPEAAAPPELLESGKQQEAAEGRRGAGRTGNVRMRGATGEDCVGREVLAGSSGQSSRREFTGWLEAPSLSALEKGSRG